jgi:Fe2+ or Zn2+ uptake regulation protein
VNTGKLHDEVTARLASAGQRYTANRRALIEMLATAGAPLTLPEILERDDALSQSSTYRSLAVLEIAGAVRRLVIGPEHARFELAEDLTDHHHHHLVCVSCGTVTDVVLDAATEVSIDEALAAVARRHHFRPDHHTLDLVGRCSECS